MRNQRSSAPAPAPILKPDRLSHTKRALEVCGVLCGYDGYVTSDRILRSMHDFDSASRIDETGIKRALRTIIGLTGDTVESKPGRGYRIKAEAGANARWVLPLLVQYLAATQPEASFHPALEGLVHRHGVKAMHYLVHLNAARELNLPVSFQYANSGKEKPVTRHVQVAAVLIRGTRVILAGRDLDKQQMRQFLLTRMSGTLELRPHRLPPIGAAIDHLYADSLMVFVGAKPRKVVIRFDSKIGPDVRREFYHPSQSITENAGDVTLQMRVNSAEEVFALLGQYLGQAEILEPAEWRKEYARRLEQGLAKNSASYSK